MTRSKRRCEQCGKRKYGTQQAALTAAVGAARYGKSWRVYYEKRCGWWHLTTKPYMQPVRREEG